VDSIEQMKGKLRRFEGLKRQNWEKALLLRFLMMLLSSAVAWVPPPTSNRLSLRLFITFDIKDSDIGVNGVNLVSQNSSLAEERHLRFQGVGRLYSKSSSSTTAATDPHLQILDRLNQATVAVVGLGGVGSWAAEALCRSGVGNLVLIDLDDICISNTNRQLHALSTTVGHMKIDEMKRRLLAVNPDCTVTLIHDFVTADNVYEIFGRLGNPAAIIDAIDGSTEKSALLAVSAEYEIPVVTCGSAAGKIDPTKIVCEDLTVVNGDKLLSNCRRKLRKEYGFAEGIPFRGIRKGKKVKKWNIAAVYSLEKQKALPSGSDASSLRRCDGALGTACFVTGSFGFVAASRVVDMIANGKLKPPSRR